jgi:hypothetical protein
MDNSTPPLSSSSTIPIPIPIPIRIPSISWLLIFPFVSPYDLLVCRGVSHLHYTLLTSPNHIRHSWSESSLCMILPPPSPFYGSL